MRKMICRRIVCFALLISICLSTRVNAGNNDQESTTNGSHPMSGILTETMQPEDNNDDKNTESSGDKELDAQIAKAFLQQLHDDWSDYTKIRTKFALIEGNDPEESRLSVRQQNENGNYSYTVFTCKENYGEVSCEKVTLSELTEKEQETVEHYDGYMSFMAISGYLKGFISGNLNNIEALDDDSLWKALFLGYLVHFSNSYYSDYKLYNPDGYDRASLPFKDDKGPAILIGRSDPYPSGILITIENGHIVENDLTITDCERRIREQYGDNWKDKFEEFTYPIGELHEKVGSDLKKSLDKKAATYENACYKLLCTLLAGEQDVMGIGEPFEYDYFSPSSYLLFSFKDITSDGVPELFVIDRVIWLPEDSGLGSWDVYTYNGAGGLDFLETCEFYDPVQDVCCTEVFGGDSDGFREYNIDDQKKINELYSIRRAIADSEKDSSGTYSELNYYRDDNNGTHTDLTEEEFNKWMEDHDRRYELYGIKEGDSFMLDPYTLAGFYDNEKVWRGDQRGSGNSSDWRRVYLDYLRNIDTDNYSSATLIFMDPGDIPEIILNGVGAAIGSCLLTTDGTNLYEIDIDRLEYKYIPKENLLHNGGGLSDCYFDRIITLQNGRFEIIFDGEFYGNPNEIYDENGNKVGDFEYKIDGRYVSGEEYERRLREVYDVEKEKDTECYLSLDELIQKLESGEDPRAYVFEEDFKVHRYEFIIEDCSWSEAWQRCLDRGGYLAHINSEEEYGYISKQIEEEDLGNYTFWLGGTRNVGSAPYGYTHYDWHWINPDGSISYSLWANGLDDHWHGGASHQSTVITGENEIQNDCLSFSYSSVDNAFCFYEAPDDLIAVSDQNKGKIGYICEYDVDSETLKTEQDQISQVITGEKDRSETDNAVFDAFLRNEIFAYYPDDFEYSGEPFKFKDTDHGEDDPYTLHEGGRIDLNNDGRKDLILENIDGGVYLYVRDGKLFVLAESNGSAVRLSHTHYDGAEWIVYGDTSHGGRTGYTLIRYNGDGEIVDQFDLSAEYWDSPDDTYNEDSKFTFRDRSITMEEFERLQYEILGIGEPPEEDKENSATDTTSATDTAKEENKDDTAESHVEVYYTTSDEGRENAGAAAGTEEKTNRDNERNNPGPSSQADTRENKDDDEAKPDNKYPAWDLDKEAEVKSILDWNEEMLQNRSNYDFYDYGGYSYYSNGSVPVYIVVRAGYNDWEPSRYYYGYDIFYVEVEYSPARVRKYYFSGFKLFRVETEDGRVIDYGSKDWDQYNEEGLRLKEEREAICKVIEGGDTSSQGDNSRSSEAGSPFSANPEANPADNGSTRTENGINNLSVEDLSNEIRIMNQEDYGEDSIDLTRIQYSPGKRDFKAIWDKTVFYVLEGYETATGYTDKNHCEIEKKQLKNASTGNLIQYEIYKNPETGVANKIVSIEYLEDGLEVTEYYYTNQKQVSFIFRYKTDNYISTYATTDKHGERYMFEEDCMVTWRIVSDGFVSNTVIGGNEADEIENFPKDTIHVYDSLSAEDKRAFNEKETEMINAAYITYEVVLAAEGIASIQGYAYDGLGEPLLNAKVDLYTADFSHVLYSVKTNASGRYVIYVPNETYDYNIRIKKKDFTECEIYMVHIYRGQLSVYQESVYLFPVSGNVLVTELHLGDAFNYSATGEGMLNLTGAIIHVRNGIGNRTGTIVLDAVSDMAGTVYLSLVPGVYTIEVSATGYEVMYYTIVVNPFVLVNRYEFYAAPELDDNELAIVLTWGALPFDLDSHLFTTGKGGNTQHIWFGHMSDTKNSYLDVDDVTSYGPETVTIRSFNSDRYYKYCVVDYTNCVIGNYGSFDMSLSGACVNVYNSDGLAATFSVPVGASGVIWEVFEIRNGEILPIQRYYNNVTDKSWWNSEKG